MIPFGQGHTMASPPTKELMRIVLECKSTTAGTCAAMNMDNAFVRTDPAGTSRLIKKIHREGCGFMRAGQRRWIGYEEPERRGLGVHHRGLLIL